MASSLLIVSSLALLVVTLLLFVAFIYGVYRSMRALWARLPSNVVSLNPDQIHKTFGLLLALLLFPSLITFAWNTIQSLVRYIPNVMQLISSFPLPSSCRNLPFDAETQKCVPEFSGSIINLVGQASRGLVTSLNLPNFPATDFVWFLLVAFIITHFIRAIYQNVTFSKVQSWYAAARETIPPAFWQRLTFTGLILVSFYLGLCALLAIPLFQDKSRPLQLTVEALTKALDANIIKTDAFDQRFPLEPPAIKEPPPLEAKDEQLNVLLVQVFKSSVQNEKELWQELNQAWVALRSTASTSPAAWRNQAVNTFAAGLEVSVGKKQTAQHYNDLLSWHQTKTQITFDVLTRCQSAIRSFAATATEELERYRTVADQALSKAANPVGTAAAGSTAVLPLELYQPRSDAFRRHDAALKTCTPVDEESVPQRPTIAAVLGPVGKLTRWLLDTEQMPVVIIVGLVGFSLLGATVSRAVRAKDENIKAGLTLDDLLAVVAGGVTAAVVVFLAAYGGMAILGSSTADPNPYVVFVTCLIGAVYSEDVWSWARRRVLNSQLEDEAPRNRDRTKSQDPAKRSGGGQTAAGAGTQQSESQQNATEAPTDTSPAGNGGENS